MPVAQLIPATPAHPSPLRLFPRACRAGDRRCDHDARRSGARDLVEPAFIRFDGDDGEMRFIAIVAWLDVRYGARSGSPIAEFSWEGVDEGDQRSGRGWVEVGTAGRLVGNFFFHKGGESGFVCGTW